MTSWGKASIPLPLNGKGSVPLPLNGKASMPCHSACPNRSLAPQAADHEIMERVELLEPTLVRV